LQPLKAITNLTAFLAEPVAFMREVAAGGQAKRVHLGPKRFVFVFSPEAAQEILIKRAPIYAQNRTVFDRIQPVTGKRGLVQLSGEESQAARAKARVMFTAASLDSARSTIEHYCDEMLKCGLTNSFDVTEELTSLVLKTALMIFLGIESEILVNKIGKQFLRLNYLCGLRMRSLFPPPLYLPTSKNREIKKLQSETRASIAREVSLREDNAIREAYGNDEDLIDHCMTFLFAGHETTASSLSFALLLLAQNPRYQELLAAGDEAMTIAVYKESLRLFPPAYMLVREATADDDLCGLAIKKSDQVIIAISELHRNPRFFVRPNEFLPERFLEKLKHPFSFIPFGAGAKSCIGERLAYLEASVVLKMVCQKFRLTPNFDAIRAEPLITLHPIANQTIQLLPRNVGAHD
jgi:cytochrome P450